MKLTGFIMIIIGAILLFFMILPFVSSMIIPRGGLPFTFTWAAVLGLFFTGAGFALLVVSREDGEEKERMK